MSIDALGPISGLFTVFFLLIYPVWVIMASRALYTLAPRKVARAGYTKAYGLLAIVVWPPVGLMLILALSLMPEIEKPSLNDAPL